MNKRRPEIVEHALELFAPLGTIRVRAMFGGWGFYCDESFFALVADDTLFLKADAETQADYLAAASEPFTYTTRDGRVVTMAYWRAPEEALESPATMLPWARGALACALRARASPPASPHRTRRKK